MNPQKNQLNRGQSMVIVALLMVGLIAMLALALDGGYAYWQRRVAQNAADSGALAGANELCTQKLVQDVNGVASSYVTKNKAQVSTINWSVASKTITVTSQVPFRSFFAGVIGYDVITVTAQAIAKCTPACLTEGVLPIAWSCGFDVNSTNPGSCELRYMDEKGPVDGQCKFGDDYYYIIADSNDAEMDIQCAPAGTIPTEVNLVDCDLNDDGVNDLKLLSGGSRAWLDLTGQSGAADINNWIRYGFPGEVRTHVWYPSQTGNIGSSYQTVYDYHLSDTVAIPVFNAFAPKGNDPRSSTDWHSNDSYVPPPPDSPNNAADYYHVITFAAFRVACVYSGGSTSSGSCPGRSLLLDSNIKSTYKNSLKTIEGCFVKDAVLGSRGYVGSGCVDTGAYAVHLVK